MFQTEFSFSLPKGYVDSDGALHKEGVMRLATASDEIHPNKDSRVQQNPAYLIIILLSRVIIKLGEIDHITTKTIEGVYSSDLSYLQTFYQQINDTGKSTIKTACPKCEHPFDVEVEHLGEE